MVINNTVDNRQCMHVYRNILSRRAVVRTDTHVDFI